MTACNVVRIIGVAVAVVWALTACDSTHRAAAVSCPDVEVVSARGTDQPPGPGSNGDALVISLKSKIPGQSVAVYAVNYPATNDFVNSESAGAADAVAHVQSTVASCPNTRIVLSGYSQGAAVIDKVTDELPPELADHVSAVALFGNPKSTYAKSLGGAHPPTLNPLYLRKTIDLCVPDDPICSEGKNDAAHQLYFESGMTEQAATFVAGKL
jgi:cutinase